MRVFVAACAVLLVGCGGVTRDDRTESEPEASGGFVGGPGSGGFGAGGKTATGGRSSTGSGGNNGSGGVVSKPGTGGVVSNPGTGGVPPIVMPPIGAETRPGADQPACYDGRPLICSEGVLTETVLATAPGPTLSIISVYESHGSHSSRCSPRGVLDVVVSKPGVHALFLTSYEPVEWNIVAVSDDVSIETVGIVGYNSMTSRVPAGVVVSQYEGAANGLTLWNTSFEYPSAEANALIRFAESQTGLKASRFLGSYCANRAVIE